MNMNNHTEATLEAGKEFYMNFKDKGELVMLNLLKFKATADYSDFENLAPTTKITGKEAFDLYLKNMSNEFNKIGSTILFYGKSYHFLIGPESEKWDSVLLVKHKSIEKFMTMAQSETYLKTVGHRSAAIADSRLLPIHEQPF